jgi:hypothetical protein
LIQLYVAGVNYARNSPEGYSPVADAKVSPPQQLDCLEEVDTAETASMCKT